MVTGAQIGRQQRTERLANIDEEKEYRHAFLVVEAKRGPGGNHPRHVLCAESDTERDSWVEMLVRYFTGNYSEEPITYVGPTSSSSNVTLNNSPAQPRSSTSSSDVGARQQPRGFSKDDISTVKTRPSIDTKVRLRDDHSPSPIRSVDSPVERVRDKNLGQPSSLPDTSPLSAAVIPSSIESSSTLSGNRAASEMGHYSDQTDSHGRHHSPERHRHREPYGDRKPFQPTLGPITSSTTSTAPERAPSPDKLDHAGKVKISGPMNGAPIPTGFKFGGKDAPTPTAAEQPTPTSDRREKAKSRSFWGFGQKMANGKCELNACVPR